ncbi:MAG: cadmium-translocating P-type ATPase [Schwartzia succinivorans]|jgi:Cd2+/Zn2+-exporting ATPase|uniref:heavy metal translocating P-type ATPase n=1 Tax=Schwartzia succinivorans TaxID=55507 RepID=UPI002353C437|nr:heavy metal translocating P-type ATPase [Schwartzia succinivorans]MBE6098288.1 cadmium-translocating P-type ATPase [Schwartzia succinivorans]
MNAKQKKNLIRIAVSGAMMLALEFVPVEGLARFVLYMIPYLIIGYDILIKAFQGIKNRQAFDESLLMAIATIGAISLALYDNGDYTEAIAVMWFYQIGEWFQSYAVGKSRNDISALMDIVPDTANVEGEDGQLEEVDPDDVEVGSVIVVRPGERVPIDGVVIDGTSSLDTSALTGEAVPRTIKKGEDVASGCINLSGVLKIRTTKEFGESTASKIMELIEDAGSRKAKTEKFITRFARVYTPIVTGLAVLLAFVMPLYHIATGAPAEWSTWIYRALIFLIMSCPCALVVSVPLSFFAGIGTASREGVLVKGASYLEALAGTKTVVFDKTGTLTKGVFDVTGIHADDIDKDMLLHMAAHVERHSSHPIAVSLRNAFAHEADSCSVEDVEEFAGQGVRAKVNGKVVYAGNEKMMATAGVEAHGCENEPVGALIHVAIEGKYAGHIIISDVVKDHSVQTLKELKKAGVRQNVMLTGDVKEVGERVAKDIGIDRVCTDLLPQDKVAKFEEILKERKDENEMTAFVGDGINDAPVLRRADIGIAMGAMGSDAAIEAADVVLMDDDPLKIPTAMRIARKCMAIVRENIWFAIGIKVVCLILGAVGMANMWFAIFADVGVTVLAVLNAFRCMFVKGIKPENA